MKKLLFIIALSIGLIGTSFNSQAQNGRFSVGAEVGLPMGDFGDASSTGFGGSLRYELPMGDNLGLMLTAGYMSFSGKDGGKALTMIPAQVGAKYYFTENQNGFYGAVELGIHSSSVKVDEVSYVDPLTGTKVVVVPEETVSNTDFSYAPEVGYHLANIDLGLRYQMIATTGSTTSYLGLRLAYVFGEK